VTPLGILVDQLNVRYAETPTLEMLKSILVNPAIGKTVVVSSFGTESAVLLHLVAQAKADTPVIMVDTGKLFGETLRYRDQLKKKLSLQDIRIAVPDGEDLQKADPDGVLWSHDIDACCDIRKVKPLAKTLNGANSWISGRKSFQSNTRSQLQIFETDGDRLKINPLAKWSKADLEQYFAAYDLPRHPLEADGYLSIGCMPCTSPVRDGEDARAGRWRGADKIECGIHRDANYVI
jgi:phosphoadenosine phosphosulfate reductase